MGGSERGGRGGGVGVEWRWIRFGCVTICQLSELSGSEVQRVWQEGWRRMEKWLSRVVLGIHPRKDGQKMGRGF